MSSLTKRQFRLGDEVSVHLGKTIWRARVVEDRGPIGKNRRRLFRLQLIDDQQNEPHFIEAPADDIRADAPHAAKNR